MTTTKTNNSSAFDRSATVGSVRIGHNEDTVIFPLSSEEPYRRYYYSLGQELDEILLHDKSAVDLTFLNSGNAPLIDTHNIEKGLASQIGVIVKAWLEDKRVYVEVRFSGRQMAQDIKKDVKDGIIRNVSIGYEVTRFEIDEDQGTYIATKWRPKEASFVPIPADTTVGIGRNDQSAKQELPMSDKSKKKGDVKVTAMPGATDKGRTDDERANDLTSAIDEIGALASEHNVGDIGRSFIKGQLERGNIPSLAMFKGVVRSKLPDGKPLTNTDVGLSDKERKSFSLVNVACDYAGLGKATFEKEVSDAARSKQKSIGIDDHGGFIIPTDVLNDFGDFTQGGVNSRSHAGQHAIGGQMGRAPMSTATNPNIQTTDHLAGSFVDNLRNVTAVLQAGMTVLDGLDNNLEIPGADQNASAFWLAAEDDDVAETTLTQRLVTLSPKDLGAYVDFTRRMLQQSTVAIEAMARMDLLIAHSLEIDAATVYGDGAAGKPTGITQTAGIGSVTFGAAIPTREEIIDMRTAVAATNRGRGVTYVGNSVMVGDLQKTRVDAGSGIFLMGDNADRLIGNPYGESNQMTDGDLLAGVFPDVLLGMWGGLQLDRSVERKYLSGGVSLRSIQTVDIAVRRVGSFTFGNDG